jgi:phosphoglycolate phosphatase
VGAVLLDLDGTLLDTIDDIATALNQTLTEQGIGSLPTSQVRDLVGRGVPSLIERAVARLGVPASSYDPTTLLDRLRFHYRRRLVAGESTARVYPGVVEGLGKLQALGLGLAVVTNKEKQAAVDLLESAALSDWVQVVVGGDSCQHRKPDAQPLLFACAALQVEPARALMVGDSITDVLAGRAVRLFVVFFPPGYNEGNDPRDLPCDAIIETLADLPALLLGASTHLERRSIND